MISIDIHLNAEISFHFEIIENSLVFAFHWKRNLIRLTILNGEVKCCIFVQKEIRLYRDFVYIDRELLAVYRQAIATNT